MGSEKKINKTSKQSSNYDAKDIYVLEGLEPVRKRPGMYVGSTGVDGLHHLVWEVVDNSIDEAMAGYADKIDIVFLPNHNVKVTDNGRGIPVDIHKQTKKSALETVMTTLHAGGKFGGDSYKISGGLHGVGVSVVNALSKNLKVEVCRDGALWAQEYKRGKPVYKTKKVGKCEKTGTSVMFEPDDEIFGSVSDEGVKSKILPSFDWNHILKHLRQQAYLVRGIRISIRDERGEDVVLHKSYSFYFEGGVHSYVSYLNRDMNVVHSKIFYIAKEVEGHNMLVEVGLQYVDDLQAREMSFANNIYTPEGGMHVTGFRTALTRTLNEYAKKGGIIKDANDNFTGDDVREGLTAIISIKLKEPQFEGQTKAKLGNPEARTVTESVFSEAFSYFLEENPRDAKDIIEKVFLALRARKAAKAAKESVLRKGVLDGLTLPGKLADCQTKNAEESELFIVEGDSAGGSCKQGRDRRFQAILPLKGKIMNVERARFDKMLSSKEVKALIIAMGTAIADDFDISKLRYHRIIIATDADVDGSHIRTLLLTLFYRYFKQIIEGGYLYIAQPPLYKVQSGKTILYAYDEEAKDKIVAQFAGSGVRIQRYKGLGEMNPMQLWETTMDPAKRVLKKVAIEDAEDADRTFDILMGKEVAPRKQFIQTHAKSVQNLDV
ncbi:DNA topoisomerase (ATP-hydrolyzing) subunit B [Patescibacteria group bacterium]|nr:DNA topoisomerase (ATP-hydrolyzing) subunit B [Patescibacteria group bacterium]MBU2633207.1 DNA topoisomerase (ATP-hydrolyzing) subunit B [Patescibacteria group bacterium]